MTDTPLDITAVQAFVLISDLGSFTRTAETMRSTQSAISLKIKRLEKRLGARLIQRSPRHIELSAEGESFLRHARQLLEAHQRALSALAGSRSRLSVGFSDHVAGPELPTLIACLNARDPELVMSVRIGSSGELLQSFDRRELDAVIVRFHSAREDGAVIAHERLGWFAGPDWQVRPGQPIPLLTMPEPCGMRSLACRCLDQAGVTWFDAFVGGGVAAVSAAVMANLGVAALAHRMLPSGARDVGQQLNLPPLPELPVIVHCRATTRRSQEAISTLETAFRALVEKAPGRRFCTMRQVGDAASPYLNVPDHSVQ